MRFSGKIGFGITQETYPDVWEPVIVERGPYRGDVISPRRTISDGTSINDNIRLRCQISVVADPFAYENMFNIRYVIFKKQKLKVTDITISEKRLILDIGDSWTEETAEENNEL